MSCITVSVDLELDPSWLCSSRRSVDLPLAFHASAVVGVKRLVVPPAGRTGKMDSSASVVGMVCQNLYMNEIEAFRCYPTSIVPYRYFTTASHDPSAQNQLSSNFDFWSMMHHLKEKHLLFTITPKVSIDKNAFHQVFAQYLETEFSNWLCADGSHM